VLQSRPDDKHQAPPPFASESMIPLAWTEPFPAAPAQILDRCVTGPKLKHNHKPNHKYEWYMPDSIELYSNPNNTPVLRHLCCRAGAFAGRRSPRPRQVSGSQACVFAAFYFYFYFQHLWRLA